MISASDRLKLHERLAETLGQPQAGTLMELLPATSWDDIATRQQLAQLGTELNGQRALDSAQVRLDFATTRDDVAKARAEIASLAGETAQLRIELKADVAKVRDEVGQMQGQFARIDNQFGAVRNDFEAIRVDMATLRVDMATLRAELTHGLNRGLMIQTGTNLMAVIAIVGLVLTLL